MNKFLFLIAFSLLSYISKAQTQPIETNTNKHFSARTPRESKFLASEPIVDDLNDLYLGHSDDYIGMFISKQLPTDFPKYSNILTVEEYKQRVTSYFKLNSALLTEKYKNKYSK